MVYKANSLISESHPTPSPATHLCKSPKTHQSTKPLTMHSFIVFAALLSCAAAIPAYGGYGYAAAPVISSYGYSTAIPAPVAYAPVVKSYAVAAPAVAIAAPVASYGYAGKGLIGGYGAGLGYSGLALGGYGAGYGLGYGKGLY